MLSPCRVRYSTWLSPRGTSRSRARRRRVGDLLPLAQRARRQERVVHPELHQRDAEPPRKGPPVVAAAHRRELHLLGVVADRPLVQHQHVAVLSDRQDVLQRLERRPAAAHPARPGVVGAERVILAAELADHLRQVLDPRLDVGLDPQRAERGRHHLEIAARARVRAQVAVAARFVEADRPREVDVDAVFFRMAADVTLDLHRLPVHAEQPGRQIVERQQLVRLRGRRGSGGGRRREREQEQRREGAAAQAGGPGKARTMHLYLSASADSAVRTARAYYAPGLCSPAHARANWRLRPI